MVQRLEANKDGGGSIKVGTVGTIGSLMTKELESVNAAPQTPVSSRNKAHRIPIPSGATIPKRSQPRKSLDEANSSGSGGSSSSNHRRTEIARKTKGYSGKTHRIPMLGSDNIALDRTPRREKTEKKTSNIVEIVDVKCGNSDRAWTSPLTNRLKKLGFSKLSDSII